MEIKYRQRVTGKWIELPTHESTGMFWVEENYKSSEILEAHTIKQAEMKGKWKKITSDERERVWNQAL